MLVEGPSDQYYLTAMKNILIGKGIISPRQELLFVPAGGTRGIKTTSKILATSDDCYPHVLLDGDAPGRQCANSLKESTYAGREDHVSLITDFMELEDAELEDFADPALVANVASKQFRGEEDFEDAYHSDKPITPQIEGYCKAFGIEMEKGWKVDLARRVKRKMLLASYQTTIPEATLGRWKNLFEKWITTNGKQGNSDGRLRRR